MCSKLNVWRLRLFSCGNALMGSSLPDLADEQAGRFAVLCRQRLRAADSECSDSLQQIRQALCRAAIEATVGSAGEASDLGIDLADVLVIVFLKHEDRDIAELARRVVKLDWTLFAGVGNQDQRIDLLSGVLFARVIQYAADLGEPCHAIHTLH